ncbi:MAG: hypothetical protein E6J14_00820 [Chloroflexi bacterium]|nr:MAG: hypothetical protein E6J14_00820 [Chloroflexota bacterium]
MRRPGWLPLVAAVLVALAAAATMVALRAEPAVAMTQARLSAAGRALRPVVHGDRLAGARPDWALVIDAWRRAGVDVDGLDGFATLGRYCVLESGDRPGLAGGPAPADYAMYQDQAGDWRLGMFVSSSEVVVWDEARQRAVRVERPALDGSVPLPPGDAAPVRRGAHELLLCRLPSWRWPGRVDDLDTAAVGRVALVDPATVAERLRWAVRHPRDADTSWWHAPVTMVGFALAAASELVSGAIDGLLHLGIDAVRAAGGGAVLAAVALLGRRFDGHVLHLVLRGVLIAGALVVEPWLVGALLAVGVGGPLLGRADVPVLGVIGDRVSALLVASASFITGLLTGVDDRGDVCAGSVVFALLADTVLWAKPLRLLRFAGTLSDVVSMRPRAVAAAARMVARLPLLAGRRLPALPGAVTVAGKAAAVREPLDGIGVLSAGAGHTPDLLSLLWRPSSLRSDLAGHTAALLDFATRDLAGGDPSWGLRHLRDAVDSLQPEQQQRVLAVARRAQGTWVPRALRAAELSRLHSGARVLANAAAGRAPAGLAMPSMPHPGTLPPGLAPPPLTGEP